MEDDQYSNWFCSPLEKGLIFNGIHCDDVHSHYIDDHINIGKLLYKANVMYTVHIDLEQVAKVKVELTNLDRFFQGSHICTL